MIKMFHCDNCNRNYSENYIEKQNEPEPQEQQRTKRDIIIDALRMLENGKTLRETANELQRNGISVTYSDVLDWHKKYALNGDKIVKK